MTMDFQPLYYEDKLLQVNPLGDTGIVTLWSPVKTIHKKLSAIGVDLAPETSRVAVFGTLFGNGIPELLRNLLYNPHIRHLVILGKDLSNSRNELTYFFERGLEKTTYLGTPMCGILGTDRKIDGHVTPEDFAGRLSVTDLSQHSTAEAPKAIRRFFERLPPQEPCMAERVRRPIPPVQVAWHPSEPRSHTILRGHPLEAWKELVFRIVRFGHRNALRKGERIELQNVKVIVQEPVEASQEQLTAHGFSLEELHAYQRSILDPTRSEEQPYTYGNRMRGHFVSDGKPIDALAATIEHLREDPEARHAYTALWDTSRDSRPGVRGHPCLVALFFRKFEEHLTLTATFRTHNALDGWLKNVYGLMAIQRYVADRTSLPMGAISVISHSISIDPQGNGMDRANAIANAKETDEVVDETTGRRSPRLDPHGEFMVTTDEASQELVVHHLYKGQLLKEYRARKSEALERMLARDLALSEISHALYLGREMAQKELQLTSSKTTRQA